MIHLRGCDCSPGEMVRIHRALWMRLLFPSRALFECPSCRTLFLASVADQADMGQRAHAERAQSKSGDSPNSDGGDRSPAG